MFPLEKASLLNIVARQMAEEQNIDKQLLNNLFTESTIKNMIESMWDVIINKLIACGSISSAIIMALLILHVLKLTVDTVINAYLLQQVYGFSIHLIAALFSSVTHLCMTLYKREEELKQTNSITKSKLKGIITHPINLDQLNPSPLPKRPPSIETSLRIDIPQTHETTTLKNVSNSRIVEKQNFGIFSFGN